MASARSAAAASRVFCSSPRPPLRLHLHREPRQPDARQQAEQGGLARKVVWTGGRQTIAREPAPQRPPGETSEPPEERTKEATDWKDDKTGRERRTRLGETGFHALVEVVLLEPTRTPKG